MDYNELVKELATEREREKAGKYVMNTLLDNAKVSQQYMDASKLQASASERVEELETAIRIRISTDALSGIKPDHAALNFRNKTTVNYDESEAIEWAISKDFRNVLQIQKTKFTKLAKSLVEAGQEIPGVAISTTPQPTIKTDLSEYL